MCCFCANKEPKHDKYIKYDWLTILRVKHWTLCASFFDETTDDTQMDFKRHRTDATVSNIFRSYPTLNQLKWHAAAYMTFASVGCGLCSEKFEIVFDIHAAHTQTHTPSTFDILQAIAEVWLSINFDFPKCMIHRSRYTETAIFPSTNHEHTLTQQQQPQYCAVPCHAMPFETHNFSKFIFFPIDFKYHFGFLHWLTWICLRVCTVIRQYTNCIFRFVSLSLWIAEYFSICRNRKPGKFEIKVYRRCHCHRRHPRRRQSFHYKIATNI